MPGDSRSLSRRDRIRGCLLGGALGDALGAPVEFLGLAEIHARYPSRPGIDQMDEAYGVVAAITDDTQMTLFTAEGLIRATVRFTLKGICHPPGVVGYAYLRWLHTQRERGVEQRFEFALKRDSCGWLVEHPGLHQRRAPGMTCLAALKEWDYDPARNDSKGCGTVMRSSPFGFFPEPWRMAWECAEITHGHLEAKASAAILAVTISNLAEGMSMVDALTRACAQDTESSNSARLVRDAVAMANDTISPEVAIRRLGEGWVADEALAIAAFCAVRADSDFREGVCLAVNHDGDSDSTGAICGNLLGTLLGVEALPRDWREQLELHDVVEQVAIDMDRVDEMLRLAHEGHPDGVRFVNQYPGG